MTDLDPPTPQSLPWRQHAANARQLVTMALRQAELACEALGPDDSYTDAGELFDARGALEDVLERLTRATRPPTTVNGRPTSVNPDGTISLPADAERWAIKQVGEAPSPCGCGVTASGERVWCARHSSQRRPELPADGERYAPGTVPPCGYCGHPSCGWCQ